MPVFNAGLVPFMDMAANPAVSGAAAFANAGRSYFNTVMALCSSIAGAFMASKSVNCKFNFEHVQRATIAGAAGVAAVAPMVNNVWGPMLLGLIVGFISVLGLQYVQPKLNAAGLLDTTGVFTTSFIPGVIGATASAIAAARVTPERGFSAASINSIVFDGRTELKQGGYQMGFLLVSIVFALITGLVVGLLLRLSIYEPKNVRSRG
jgi:ammonia channel protein AmtB